MAAVVHPGRARAILPRFRRHLDERDGCWTMRTVYLVALIRRLIYNMRQTRPLSIERLGLFAKSGCLASARSISHSTAFPSSSTISPCRSFSYHLATGNTSLIGETLRRDGRCYALACSDLRRLDDRDAFRTGRLHSCKCAGEQSRSKALTLRRKQAGVQPLGQERHSLD